MDDLDPILAQLGRMPADGRLDALEPRIFARIDALRETRRRNATLARLALGALAIGLTSNLLPASQPPAAPSLAQLAGPPPLAPSNLLAAGHAG